jgi:hypothetical protein
MLPADYEEGNSNLGHLVKHKRGPPVAYLLYIDEQLVKYILRMQEQELTSIGSSIHRLAFRLVENLG